MRYRKINRYNYTCNYVENLFTLHFLLCCMYHSFIQMAGICVVLAFPFSLSIPP